MKETTKKNMIHENIHNRKDVVKILDIIYHESDDRTKTIVVYRKVQPMLRAIPAFNSYVLEFDFTYGTRKTYSSIGQFEEQYKWFTEDAETNARIREGFYEV